MTEAEVAKIAHEAAAQAAKETLTSLGIDTTSPTEMQHDFAWMRRWRLLSEKVGSRVLITVVTLATVGVGGAVWASLKATLGK